MNHPQPEEWMSYLYDEANSKERAHLRAHLQTCAECAAKLGEWQSARKNLDAWRLPRGAKRARVALAAPAFKWAAAAAIFLGAGFLAGRLASAAANVEEVRVALEPQIRQQLRRELAQEFHDELDKTASAALAASAKQTRALLADYAAAFETKRIADNTAIVSALDKLGAQRFADYLSLKKDVDTVAVNADAGFRSTEQQLMQLADYTPAGPRHSQPK
jgi:electron transfer flavoprotein alpha subunit